MPAPDVLRRGGDRIPRVRGDPRNERPGPIDGVVKGGNRGVEPPWRFPVMAWSARRSRDCRRDPGDHDLRSRPDARLLSRRFGEPSEPSYLSDWPARQKGFKKPPP
jgi:hypothetical protein